MLDAIAVLLIAITCDIYLRMQIIKVARYNKIPTWQLRSFTYNQFNVRC